VCYSCMFSWHITSTSNQTSPSYSRVHTNLSTFTFRRAVPRHPSGNLPGSFIQLFEIHLPNGINITEAVSTMDDTWLTGNSIVNISSMKTASNDSNIHQWNVYLAVVGDLSERWVPSIPTMASLQLNRRFVLLTVCSVIADGCRLCFLSVVHCH